MPSRSSVSGRAGVGLASAAVAGAVTAAVESMFEAGPEGLGPALITFAALFAAYGFVAICSVGIANVFWLVARPLLEQLEFVLLPLLTSSIAWQIFTGTHWGLLSSRAIILCSALLFVGYLFALNRLRAASAAS